MIKRINNKRIYDMEDLIISKFNDSLIYLFEWNGKVEDFLYGNYLGDWISQNQLNNEVDDSYEHMQHIFYDGKEFAEYLINSYECGFGEEYDYIGIVIDKKLVWYNKGVSEDSPEEQGECIYEED